MRNYVVNADGTVESVSHEEDREDGTFEAYSLEETERKKPEKPKVRSVELKERECTVEELQERHPGIDVKKLKAMAESHRRRHSNPLAAKRREANRQRLREIRRNTQQEVYDKFLKDLEESSGAQEEDHGFTFIVGLHEYHTKKRTKSSARQGGNRRRPRNKM